VFEEFGFNALQRLPAPVASSVLYNHHAATGNLAAFPRQSDVTCDDEHSLCGGLGGSLCCVVVDIGYSATYVVPCVKGLRLLF
jgi:actin-related protein